MHLGVSPEGIPVSPRLSCSE